MNYKKRVKILMYVWCICSLFTGCLYKNGLTLGNYNDFKEELKQDYDYINFESIKLKSWEMGVGITIITKEELTQEQVIPIFEDVRKYLINSYDEIDDYSITSDDMIFCEDMGIVIYSTGHFEEANTFSSVYSRYSDEEGGMIADYFKTWIYYNKGTRENQVFYYENEGVKRVYEDSNEEINKR